MLRSNWSVKCIDRAQVLPRDRLAYWSSTLSRLVKSPGCTASLPHVKTHGIQGWMKYFSLKNTLPSDQYVWAILWGKQCDMYSFYLLQIISFDLITEYCVARNPPFTLICAMFFKDPEQHLHLAIQGCAMCDAYLAKGQMSVFLRCPT